MASTQWRLWFALYAGAVKPSLSPRLRDTQRMVVANDVARTNRAGWRMQSECTRLMLKTMGKSSTNTSPEERIVFYLDEAHVKPSLSQAAMSWHRDALSREWLRRK